MGHASDLRYEWGHPEPQSVCEPSQTVQCCKCINLSLQHQSPVSVTSESTDGELVETIQAERVKTKLLLDPPFCVLPVKSFA